MVRCSTTGTPIWLLMVVSLKEVPLTKAGVGLGDMGAIEVQKHI